jgi:L-fuculokinase
MSSTVTAILDVGKTHVRVCLVDQDGVTRDQRRYANTVAPGPPYPHADVEKLFTLLCEALADLAASKETTVDAIVPVAHGATAALVGGDGALVLPVLDYEHDVPPLPRDAKAWRETLSPALPAGLNLVNQLAWLQATWPEEFARAEHLLPYPQYWALRLGGRPVAEVTSLGCHTHLWAPSACAPSELARERGWDELLPPLVPAWECVGSVSEEVVARTGLSPTCRVHAGVHDSNASFLQHRLAHDGPFAVVSTGTWVVVMAHGADPSRLIEERDMLANVDVFGDPVPGMRFAGGREYATIAGEDGLTAEPGSHDVQCVLREGRMALPAFSEQGGPFAGREGRVLPERPQDPMRRAALASVYAALMIDLCLDDLGAVGDVAVVGPMAANDAVMTTLAALRPDDRVYASGDPTGTTRGAALLANWERRRPALDLRRVASAPIRGLDDHRALWRDQVSQDTSSEIG